ncbi:MAG: hypothetical protein FWF91_03745 [Coriobacteriia bacterium]|nr:hypothetical protein [Coriobacteriia bacterium]
MEILAAALGGLAGIIGCVPYVLLSRAVRNDSKGAGAVNLALMLMIPVISFILILIAMILCWYLAPQYLLVFAVTCVIVFLLSTGAYVLAQARKMRS